MFSIGRLTVSVNNFPLLKADATAKSVEVELKGVKETGLSLNALLKMGGPKSGGIFDALKGGEDVANKLDQMGWKFSLYDGGSSILTMGRGVSGFSGHISFNPLKIWRVLGSL